VRSVAESAQFSAAVTELTPPGTAGSALTLQVAAGFTLTALTILPVGAVGEAGAEAWRSAFMALALGPAIGIVAMWRLRRRPEAVKMASGNRWSVSCPAMNGGCAASGPTDEPQEAPAR
jgi:predicted MFS family arabinose efflux permease